MILDSEHARKYGVTTKALNQAVKRNIERFPPDFAFQLTTVEFADLRSKIVTSRSVGGRRDAPYAFTEQGVAMLSSVPRSPRAVRVNIESMRAFVRPPQKLAGHSEVARKVEALEKKYDGQFKVVVDALRQWVIEPADPPKPPIGYETEERIGPQGRRVRSSMTGARGVR